MDLLCDEHMVVLVAKSLKRRGGQRRFQYHRDLRSVTIVVGSRSRRRRPRKTTSGIIRQNVDGTGKISMTLEQTTHVACHIAKGAS